MFRLLKAFVIVALFLVLVDAIDVMTIVDDTARRGGRMALWEPVTLEFTSGAAALAFCPLILAALRRAPPGRSAWLRLLAVHAGASLLFSVLHVAAMNALRIAFYAARGLHYRFAPSDFLYEYRKDLLAYIVLAGIFWLFARPREVSARPEPAAAPPSAPRSFDIVDGNRTLRTPVGEIVALRAAGNYVEFLLADGRKPLMRAALSEMARGFEPFGFVRIHRSWAVNAARIREIAPAGSGDFTVRLDGGTVLPLSRRFRDALPRLRSA